MTIIAVAGRKGGIGKSTIAGDLAGEFAAMNHRVLVLDADPQHSLIAWAEQGEGLLSRCTEKIEGGQPSELKARVRKIKDADVVVIDTPPGMPETAYAAAMVADLVLLPCGPSPLDLFALKDALGLALKARAQRQAKKPRIRLVPSKVTQSTTLGRSLPERLEKMGKKLLPAISQRVILAEAIDAGLTIGEFAPNSPSHAEFQALAKAALKVTS